jgi:hypothetical protein
MYIRRIYIMLSEPPGSLPSIDRAVLERTARLLRAHHADIARVVQRMESGEVGVVEVRTVIATLRALMLDVTFDDSFAPGDVAELSELFELWRTHLDRATE